MKTTEVAAQTTEPDSETNIVIGDVVIEETTLLTVEQENEPEQLSYVFEDIAATTYYPTQDLNCRIQPDVNSERVTTFSRNAKLIATKKSDNDWYYVSGNNYEGWCNGYYLSVDKAITKPATHNNTTSTSNNSSIFKLTAYCACSKCCGKWANGITATGTTAVQGRTVAVYPSQIPLGSSVYIEGYGTYVAEDTGVGYGVIDIYFNSHTEALNFGVRYAKVTW